MARTRLSSSGKGRHRGRAGARRRRQIHVDPDDHGLPRGDPCHAQAEGRCRRPGSRRSSRASGPSTWTTCGPRSRRRPFASQGWSHTTRGHPQRSGKTWEGTSLEPRRRRIQAVVKRARARARSAGSSKMIEDGRDCQDIVTQMAAVSTALTAPACHDLAGAAPLRLGPGAQPDGRQPWRGFSSSPSPDMEAARLGCWYAATSLVRVGCAQRLGRELVGGMPPGGPHIAAGEGHNAPSGSSSRGWEVEAVDFPARWPCSGSGRPGRRPAQGRASRLTAVVGDTHRPSSAEGDPGPVLFCHSHPPRDGGMRVAAGLRARRARVAQCSSSATRAATSSGGGGRAAGPGDPPRPRARRRLGRGPAGRGRAGRARQRVVPDADRPALGTDRAAPSPLTPVPGVEVERVSDAVWRVGTPTVGLTTASSCAVNSGPSSSTPAAGLAGRQVQRAVRELTALPLVVVNTHDHWDHWFNAVLDEPGAAEQRQA